MIVIDEINSSPMMEKFLNALLMGKNPDTGEPPNKVGFMVIGTQNPATMAGRRIASTALQRRLTTMTIPEYHQDEMKQILLQQGIDKDTADDLITNYLERRRYAKAYQLSPVPCFRDLLKLAKTQVVAAERAPKKPLSTADSVESQDKSIDFLPFSENIKANLGELLYLQIKEISFKLANQNPFFPTGRQLGSVDN